MVDERTDSFDEQLLSGEIEPADVGPVARRSRLVGIVVGLVVIALAVAISYNSIHDRERQFTEELGQRLEIFAQGRAGVIETWLEGVFETTKRVTGSDLFRLFSADADTLERAGSDGSPANAERQQLTTSIAEQLPLITNVLKEFAENTGFERGRLLSRSGDVYISTDAVLEMAAPEKTLGLRVFETGTPVFGAARPGPQGLTMSIALPIFPPQDGETPDDVVSALVLTLNINKRVLQFLDKPSLARPGEVVRIVQRGPDGISLLAPAAVPPVQPPASAPADLVTAQGRLPLAERSSLIADEMVYSAGTPVAALDWWVVMEADIDGARAAVDSHRNNVIGIAVLAVGVLLAAFGAFWWRLTGEQSKALARQFQQLARRINAQRRLLDSINNTIADHIGLKSLDGKYRYANPAFAEAVGRPLTELVGLDDAAIFGRGTADRLAQSDRAVIEGGDRVVVNERIFLQEEPHHLQISKVPLSEADGDLQGIVSVSRDITDLVHEQERRERVVRQTVIALVRAIELRDPYLAGHSRRLGTLAGLVAEKLGAPEALRSTVEIAANLSQVGKLSISRALLTKTERMTTEEVAIMQGHVEHAARVLRDIDFDLPVAESVYQMYERLDGGGYPNQLKGDEIGLAARILGACDVFCARIAPRSYRPAISTATALDILSENDDRYDPAVIAALRQVIQSREGERLLANLEP